VGLRWQVHRRARVYATADNSAHVSSLSAIAALGGFLFGFDSGMTNGTAEALTNAFGIATDMATKDCR